MSGRSVGPTEPLRETAWVCVQWKMACRSSWMVSFASQHGTVNGRNMGKTCDTMWLSHSRECTQSVHMPSPFSRSALMEGIIQNTCPGHETTKQWYLNKTSVQKTCFHGRPNWRSTESKVVSVT